MILFFVYDKVCHTPAHGNEVRGNGRDTRRNDRLQGGVVVGNDANVVARNVVQGLC